MEILCLQNNQTNKKQPSKPPSVCLFQRVRRFSSVPFHSRVPPAVISIITQEGERKRGEVKVMITKQTEEIDKHKKVYFKKKALNNIVNRRG